MEVAAELLPPNSRDTELLSSQTFVANFLSSQSETEVKLIHCLLTMLFAAGAKFCFLSHETMQNSTIPTMLPQSEPEAASSLKHLDH